MLAGVIRPLLHSKELDNALNIIAQVLVLKLDLERTGYPVLFKQSSDESRIYPREALTLKGGSTPTYYFGHFLGKKLHEIETMDQEATRVHSSPSWIRQYKVLWTLNMLFSCHRPRIP